MLSRAEKILFKCVCFGSCNLHWTALWLLGVSESWTVVDRPPPSSDLNLVSLSGLGVGAARKFTQWSDRYKTKLHWVVPFPQTFSVFPFQTPVFVGPQPVSDLPWPGQPRVDDEWSGLSTLLFYFIFKTVFETNASYFWNSLTLELSNGVCVSKMGVQVTQALTGTLHLKPGATTRSPPPSLLRSRSCPSLSRPRVI